MPFKPDDPWSLTNPAREGLFTTQMVDKCVSSKTSAEILAGIKGAQEKLLKREPVGVPELIIICADSLPPGYMAVAPDVFKFLKGE